MYSKFLDHTELMTPADFQEEVEAQAKAKKDFFRLAIKRFNLCMVEVAGGKTPSPNYPSDKDRKDNIKYREFLESEYAQKQYNLVPNMLHIELRHYDGVDPDSFYKELREKFIKAGWSDRTVVHMRPDGSSMIWVSVEND